MLPFRTIQDVCINGSPSSVYEMVMSNKYPNVPKCRISRKILFMKEHHTDFKRCISQMLEYGLYDNLQVIMSLDDHIAGMVLSEIRGPIADNEFAKWILTKYGHINYILLSECLASNNIERVNDIIKVYSRELRENRRHTKLKLYRADHETFVKLLDYSSKNIVRNIQAVIKHDNINLFREIMVDYKEYSDNMVPYIRSQEMYDLIVPHLNGLLLYTERLRVTRLYDDPRLSSDLRSKLLDLFVFSIESTCLCLQHYIKYRPSEFCDALKKAASNEVNVLTTKNYIDLLAFSCSHKDLSVTETLFNIIGRDYKTLGIRNARLFMCKSVFLQMTYLETIEAANEYSLRGHYAMFSPYWANYFGIIVDPKIKVMINDHTKKLCDTTIVCGH